MDKQLTWYCFKYFAYLDQSNATIHCSPPRYSPITFRLAEALTWTDRGGSIHPIEGKTLSDNILLSTVLDDIGRYKEDRGRIENENSTEDSETNS